METNRNGDVSFPELEAIITSFEPIREAQTRLEASDSPTMHLVLPMVEHIKKTLTRSASVSAIDLEGVNMQGICCYYAPQYAEDRIARSLGCGCCFASSAEVAVFCFWYSSEGGTENKGICFNSEDDGYAYRCGGVRCFR